MARSFADIEFGYEDVLIDGNRFERCHFRNSRLIYRGDALPAFQDCEMSDRVELVLGGRALLTVQLLSLFYQAGNGAGAKAVERLFDDLRRGAFG